MSLPDEVSTCRVTGSYVGFDGEPAEGEVHFYPTVNELLSSSGVAVLKETEPLVGTLTDGELDFTVPATDDPDLTPAGWGYTVVERFCNRENAGPYTILAPSSGVDLPTAAPADPVEELAGYVLTVNGQAPDSAGNVDVTAAVGEVDWSAVLNKPETFPPSPHTHPTDQIIGLATVATTGSYNDLTDTPAAPDLSDTPRFVRFALTWPARPAGARLVFWIGGDSVMHPPTDAEPDDVWIPES